jgi:hypothetical protein
MLKKQYAFFESGPTIDRNGNKSKKDLTPRVGNRRIF